MEAFALGSLLESEVPEDFSLGDVLLSSLLEELPLEATLLSAVSLLPFSAWRLGRP